MHVSKLINPYDIEPSEYQYTPYHQDNKSLQLPSISEQKPKENALQKAKSTSSVYKGVFQKKGQNDIRPPKLPPIKLLDSHPFSDPSDLQIKPYENFLHTMSIPNKTKRKRKVDKSKKISWSADMIEILFDLHRKYSLDSKKASRKWKPIANDMQTLFPEYEFTASKCIGAYNNNSRKK